MLQPYRNDTIIMQGCSRYPCKCQVCTSTSKDFNPDTKGGDLPVRVYHNASRQEARVDYLSRFPEAKKLQVAFI